jgi:DNA-binding MarR family transcriptional regulator
MAAERTGARRKRAKGAEGPAPLLRGLPGYLADDGPPDLDRLVHERVRLGVLSALAVNDRLAFTELKELLKTSDGNLSVHARKLEDAGYVKCLKSFDGRFPRTEYQLTASGRRALERYLDHMEALIRATRGDA